MDLVVWNVIRKVKILIEGPVNLFIGKTLKSKTNKSFTLSLINRKFNLSLISWISTLRES